MSQKRVAILVYVDTDAMHGSMNTIESVRDNIQAILENMMPHYNPEVTEAPDELQPITNEGSN